MKQDIIEKVQKLLKVASDKGATEAEAYTAYMQAQKLTIKHGMSLVDIENSNDENKAETIIENEIESITFANKFNQYLIKTIASNFRCELLVMRGNRKVRALIVGNESDASIAKEVIISAYGFMNKKSKQYKSVGTYYMNSYKLGFITGLKEKYKDNLSLLKRELAEERQDTSSIFSNTCGELVLSKSNDLVQYLENMGINKVYKSNAREPEYDYNSAYEQGFEDAKGFGVQLSEVRL